MCGVNAKTAEMNTPQEPLEEQADVDLGVLDDDRLQMGDCCTPNGPFCRGTFGRVIELPGRVSNASHVARLTDYFSACFGIGSGAPDGGAGTRRGAGS
jgi:hypothetical protein